MPLPYWWRVHNPKLARPLSAAKPINLFKSRAPYIVSNPSSTSSWPPCRLRFHHRPSVMPQDPWIRLRSLRIHCMSPRDFNYRRINANGSIFLSIIIYHLLPGRCIYSHMRMTFIADNFSLEFACNFMAHN